MNFQVLASGDIVQLSALCFVTGGVGNPFAVLLIAPVGLAAATVRTAYAAAIAVLACICIAVLAVWSMPLPPVRGEILTLPPLYNVAMAVALEAGVAFTASYAWRASIEASRMELALNVTQTVLAREQQLSALGALAAAAAHELGTPLATIQIVAKEMARGAEGALKEDADLLVSQAERCREILKRLTSLSSESEAHMAQLPVTSLIEEVIAPHRDFGIAIKLEPGPRLGAEPVARRNPGVLYGLGNIVENAVDFAHEKVTVRWRWDEEWVSIEVIDDGPGFPPEILDRIGEPYMTTRQTSEEGGGLGLGLFIAKTLIERSGATIRFANGAKPGMGATVAIVWPRSLFVAGGTGDTTPY